MFMQYSTQNTHERILTELHFFFKNGYKKRITIRNEIIGNSQLKKKANSFLYK